MSWEWSHTEEAYSDAFKNLCDLDRETLCVIMAEWDTEIFNGGEYLDGFYDKRLQQLMEDKFESCETLARQIWIQCAESQEINGQWFGRTCDNGGFNAWMCPHGCHTVPFSKEEQED